MTAELIHRLHFAFTVTCHYLFPQLTMGLALLIVILKTVALRSGDEQWDKAARFWGRIFGINFVFGVVTGIPMEFEFGTNWAHFSQLSGGVIGQPLAMEGVFSFFLESAFLGLFLYGEKRLSKTVHWFSAVMVWLPSGRMRSISTFLPRTATFRASVRHGMPRSSASRSGTTPWSQSEAWRPHSTRSAPPSLRIAAASVAAR